MRNSLLRIYLIIVRANETGGLLNTARFIAPFCSNDYSAAIIMQ